MTGKFLVVFCSFKCNVLFVCLFVFYNFYHNNQSFNRLNSKIYILTAIQWAGL